jgi:hypothetical protein
MAAAMVDPWQQFGAAVQALRIAFGQVLIPMLQPLMDKLVGIGKTMTKWTQLFPNITRVMGIATLAVLAITAGISALTMVVGLSKMAMMSLNVVWTLLTWSGWKSIAMFVAHTVQGALFIVRILAMIAVMGLAKASMLIWQGAIWLVNAALAANPVGLVVLGVLALVAVIVAAIAYWDDWTSALMNTAAFQWISEQLSALGAWFNSMGGWSSMAKAAWDGIVAVFKSALDSLIAMLNKIPGVDIEMGLGNVPELPNVGADAEYKPIGSLSPTKADAVPAGGLMTSIQNTQNQNRGNHIEKVEIHTAKPMSPLELENMVAMATG